MPMLKPKSILTQDGVLFYECPGCKTHHAVPTRSSLPNGAGPWGFNGDLLKPTVTPSVHVNPQRLSIYGKSCHHFVRDGQIQFLNDCDHELAGKTISLPAWED